MPVRALSEPLPCEELSVVSCRIFCSDPMACAPNCGVEFFVVRLGNSLRRQSLS